MTVTSAFSRVAVPWLSLSWAFEKSIFKSLIPTTAFSSRKEVSESIISNKSIVAANLYERTSVSVLLWPEKDVQMPYVTFLG